MEPIFLHISIIMVTSYYINDYGARYTLIRYFGALKYFYRKLIVEPVNIFFIIHT